MFSYELLVPLRRTPSGKIRHFVNTAPDLIILYVGADVAQAVLIALLVKIRF